MTAPIDRHRRDLLHAALCVALCPLSAICPHAGCGVSTVRASELVCPCHGSTFTVSGARVAGPAPEGLTALSVTYDAATRRLTVRRSRA